MTLNNFKNLFINKFPFYVTALFLRVKPFYHISGHHCTVTTRSVHLQVKDRGVHLTKVKCRFCKCLGPWLAIHCPLLEEVSIHFTKVNMQTVWICDFVGPQLSSCCGKGSISQRSIMQNLWVAGPSNLWEIPMHLKESHPKIKYKWLGPMTKSNA